MKSAERVRRRVGLVGAGYIAEHHVGALRAIPNVEIVGIVDLDQEKARRFAAQRKIGGVFSSLTAMAAAGLDVVHVLTSPDSHAAVALEAIELGADVLVEKPLATRVEDCDRIAEAAARHGRRVAVNHSLLTDPQVSRLLRWVREGRLGDIVSAEYFCSSVYPEWSGGPVPPQYREGGYPFRDLGVHGLYLLRELLGPIEGVDVRFLNRGGDPNLCFDEWRAMVRCRQGSGHIYLSWNINPLQTVLAVYGTRGSARADIGLMFTTARRGRPIPKAFERICNACEDTAPALWQVFANVFRFVVGRLKPYQGLRSFVREFYDCLDTGRDFPTSLEAAREVIGWLEEGARRADLAKTVRLAPYRKRGDARVVVTGASGFLGRHLTARLLEQGTPVRLLVRQPERVRLASHANVEIVQGDLGDREAVDIAMNGAQIVYHLGAAMQGGWGEHQRATIGGTAHVIESCLEYRVRRLVYVSSLSVLHWAGLSGCRTVKEDAPLESRAAERGFYTQAKLAAERLVLEAVTHRGLPAVVLRPGQIAGPDTPVAALCNALAVGRWMVLLGAGNTPLPLVHVEDVVDALLLVGQAPAIRSGAIYHVVDPEPISQAALAWRLASANGLRVIRLPNAVVNPMALALEGVAALTGQGVPLTRYRLRSSQAALRFDCSKVRAELGWAPRVGLRAGMGL